MLATLNTLTKGKDRLIEITVDGQITEDEIPDFIAIQKELEKMSMVIDSLNLWIDQTIINGQLDKNFIKK